MKSYFFILIDNKRVNVNFRYNLFAENCKNYLQITTRQ